MADFTRIAFKTIDGITLRGNFFPAQVEAAPVVVMTQGLTLLKEHFIDDTARRFQAAGIAVLVYDHRGYGSSDGAPRHETNPLQQAEDYHDAVTAALAQPGIDPNRVAMWGIGHSGGAVMMAAGDDPRVKAVILNMPFYSGSQDAKGFPPGILEKAWRDRREQTDSPEPTVTYVNPWPTSLANAIGKERERTFLTSEHAWNFFNGSKARSDAAGTPWENKLTLQSFYHLARVEPRDHISKIAPRAMLYLAAAEDPLTGPVEAHREVFARAGANAEFEVITPDHLATYFGDAFERSIAIQLEFLERTLVGA